MQKVFLFLVPKKGHKPGSKNTPQKPRAQVQFLFNNKRLGTYCTGQDRDLISLQLMEHYPKRISCAVCGSRKFKGLKWCQKCHVFVCGDQSPKTGNDQFQ